MLFSNVNDSYQIDNLLEQYLGVVKEPEVDMVKRLKWIGDPWYTIS